ncbi:uncharacterized protein LOC123509454 [Portunus trituberculatus]|uniref:uncharacterized protein LOC123509454 n=1 Tax=Portunus trituberculatus TaxID=210409 RepID=UPI001E1D10F2|nr:uncharacterized protein LOC123509454 [Portunus trituberculatus]
MAPGWGTTALLLMMMMMAMDLPVVSTEPPPDSLGSETRAVSSTSIRSFEHPPDVTLRGDFLDYAYTGGRQPIKVRRPHDSDDFYDDPADSNDAEYDDYYYYYFDDDDSDDTLTKDDRTNDLDLLHDNVIHKDDNIKSRKCSCDKEKDGSEKFQIKGAAGVDFPALTSLPRTSFRCEGRELGYYADLETRCQVFHVCEPGNAQHDFLCPKGTIFNQKYIVCDWWYNVDCPRSPEFFDINQDFFKDGKITAPPAPPPSVGSPVHTPVVSSAGLPLTHQQGRPKHRRRKQRPRPRQQAQAEPVTPQAEEYVPPLPPDVSYSRPEGVAAIGNVRSSFGSPGGPRPPTSAAGLPYVTPSRGTGTSGGSVSPVRSTVRPQQRPRAPSWRGNTRSRTRQLGGGLEVSYRLGGHGKAPPEKLTSRPRAISQSLPSSTPPPPPPLPPTTTTPAPPPPVTPGSHERDFYGVTPSGAFEDYYYYEDEAEDEYESLAAPVSGVGGEQWAGLEQLRLQEVETDEWWRKYLGGEVEEGNAASPTPASPAPALTLTPAYTPTPIPRHATTQDTHAQESEW